MPGSMCCLLYLLFEDKLVDCNYRRLRCRIRRLDSRWKLQSDHPGLGPYGRTEHCPG